MAREWDYWTRNKLNILKDYLPAFCQASRSSSEIIYLDLMAGEPENMGKGMDEHFDGSPRLAMQTNPGFTKLVFCERNPKKSSDLRSDLASRFQNDQRWRVVEGDCNTKIDQILSSLAHISWAPTFAFVDQQAAEVTWETLTKVAHFRTNKKNIKTELWVLMSPAMIIKGVSGTNAESFANQVDLLYGDNSWRLVLAARQRNAISPEDFRVEMVNLFRWNLQNTLGYAITARIPMRMTNNIALYDMVFATDHPVGQKIMTELYRSAADREPMMKREAMVRTINSRTERNSQNTLFEVTPDQLAVTKFPNWEPNECWDPSQKVWW
ncbi:MAG: three-Cys-motif partner protein TcmP [Actinobacteria bacterium]|nr:three-Cys-motif partner protein TcmP [Actinomycetota bacterium]